MFNVQKWMKNYETDMKRSQDNLHHVHPGVEEGIPRINRSPHASPDPIRMSNPEDRMEDIPIESVQIPAPEMNLGLSRNPSTSKKLDDEPRTAQFETFADNYMDNQFAPYDDQDLFTPVPQASGESRAKYWARFVWRRIPFYVPIIHWLPHYDLKNWLLKDVAAGVTTASILIPQALAYATLAGLPPIVGLYTAWMPLLIYLFFGTSKQLSIGPDALASLLVGLSLAESNLSAANRIELAHVLALMSGLFLFVLGIFRFGFIDNILSRPLLVGFIDAVALIIIGDQLDTLVGMRATGYHGLRKIYYIFDHLDDPGIQWITFGISVASIVYLVAWKIAKYFAANTRWAFIAFFPDILSLVVISILVTWGLRLDKDGVRIVGKIPDDFPSPQAPALSSFGVLRDNLVPAASIGFIGFIESIIVAKFYANKHNYQINGNRELTALGLSNVVGSFFRTYPCFGSLTRSSIADGMGAQSQLFSFIASIFILFTILFLGPAFHYLPNAVMASIIFVTAMSLIEVTDIIFLWKIRAWKELFLFFVTFFATVALNPEYGILLSLAISIFLVIKHTSLPHITILGRNRATGDYAPIGQGSDTVALPEILIVKIEESLYFANIEQIKEMFIRIEKLGATKEDVTGSVQRQKPIRAIIIHAGSIPNFDAGATQLMGEMIAGYHQRGIIVCFVKLRDHLKTLFVRAGLGELMLFSSTPDAVQFVEEQLHMVDAAAAVAPTTSHRREGRTSESSA